jgi:CheY-like chemotaxis protein
MTARGRVLVIDDDVGIRTLLGLVLERAGHEIVGEAGDGAAAVRLAKSLRPDVVTMDIDLPILDGLTATQRIVRGRLGRVVVVTGSPVDEAEAALAAGADAYVPKAELASLLLPTVEAVLASTAPRKRRSDPAIEPIRGHRPLTDDVGSRARRRIR